MKSNKYEDLLDAMLRKQMENMPKAQREDMEALLNFANSPGAEYKETETIISNSIINLPFAQKEKAELDYEKRLKTRDDE